MTDPELLGSVLRKMITAEGWSSPYIDLEEPHPSQSGHTRISIEVDFIHITEQEYQALLRAGVKPRGPSDNA